MSASSQRYLSVWLRRIATDRIAKRFAPAETLIIAAPVKGALRLSAVNDVAAALGLRVGMPLADARAMHPTIAVAEADARADFSLLEAIADWCDRYTPLVGLDPPDGLVLDVTGCAHLFGGETALARDLAQRLGSRGLQARVAVAGTIGCAWGVARYSDFLPPPERGRSMRKAHRVGVVASGEEKNALSPLPLAALRLDTETVTALAQVGLKHVADVLDRPRAPLAARFGASFVRRIDQALGLEDEPITPRLPVPAAFAEQRFPEPIAHERDVLGTIERLAARLAHVLEQRGEGARLLQLVLFRADGKVFRVEAGTGAPLRAPRLVVRLFADRLDVIGDEVDPGFGFDMVRLCALVTERSDPQQTGLAAPDHAADLAHLIDRLGARFGLRRVMRQMPEDTHIPEFAVTAVAAASLPRHAASSAHSRTRVQPSAGPGTGSSGNPEFRTGSPLTRGRAEVREHDHPSPTRPIRLFARPEPIDAIAEVPDGPPAQFIWRHALHIVACAEGPERIAMEWWRDETGRTLMRDYFRVESREGVRVWLYHAWPADPRLAPRWFVHGVFA
jgi:protein ImuB